MQKKSNNFPMEDMMQFAKSPQGQQLFAMLKNSTDPAIKKAIEQVSKGDLKGAAQALKGCDPSSEMQKIIKEAGGQ